MPMATPIAARTICQAMRAPKIERLSTSRPRASVPAMWSRLGGLKTPCSVRFGSRGSAGAISGANAATMPKANRSAAPTTAGRLRA